ncbi:hypothetical protein SAMN05216378_1866 [Paenibacillus catalpae]|uniref:Uncharacterized protein n=1 Tax=Paenibacillus catalpae TaxID=1045775 RepID=A0A1I1WXZ2_9BACL|nr:hypothetical protein SAMN05216378_1866 [Paenibacillus catalpae]
MKQAKQLTTLRFPLFELILGLGSAQKEHNRHTNTYACCAPKAERVRYSLKALARKDIQSCSLRLSSFTQGFTIYIYARSNGTIDRKR